MIVLRGGTIFTGDKPDDNAEMSREKREKSRKEDLGN